MGGWGYHTFSHAGTCNQNGAESDKIDKFKNESDLNEPNLNQLQKMNYNLTLFYYINSFNLLNKCNKSLKILIITSRNRVFYLPDKLNSQLGNIISLQIILSEPCSDLQMYHL